MKTLIPGLFLLLCFRITTAQQPLKVLIETSLIDELSMVIKQPDGSYREVSLPSYRCTGGGYLTTIKYPANTFFQVKCQACRQKISFRLFNQRDKKASFYIELEKGQKIAYTKCYNPSVLVEYGEGSLAKNIRKFIEESRNHRNDSKRQPITMGGPDSEDPQMAFYQSDSISLFSSNDLHLEWVSYKPIKEIYIISHNFKMVLKSESQEEANIWVKKQTIPESAIPEWIPLNIEKGGSPDSVMQYTLTFDMIRKQLEGIQEFQPGEFYQLGVELEGDKSDHNPYLFNFTVFLDDELKEVTDFFDIREDLREIK